MHCSIQRKLSKRENREIEKIHLASPSTKKKEAKNIENQIKGRKIYQAKCRNEGIMRMAEMTSRLGLVRAGDVSGVTQIG